MRFAAHNSGQAGACGKRGMVKDRTDSTQNQEEHDMEQSNRRQDTGGRKGMPKRMLALALAFAMVFTSFDLPVLAEGAAQSAAASVSAESTAVPVSTDAAAGTQAPAQSAEPVTAEDSAALTVTAARSKLARPNRRLSRPRHRRLSRPRHRRLSRPRHRRQRPPRLSRRAPLWTASPLR